MIVVDKNENLQHETAASSLAPEEIHLSEYWAILVKRRRLIVLVVVLALLIGAAKTMITPPTYAASAILNIEREKGSPADISSQPYIYDTDLATQIRLITSRDIAERAARKLGRPHLPASVAANPVRGTNLVEISAVGGDGKLCADAANAVAEAYIDWKLEAKFDILGQATQFLSRQIDELKVEIQRKETQLQAYGRSKDIVSAEPGSNVAMQNLQSMNSAHAAAVADRVAKDARYRELASGRDDTVAELSGNPVVAQVRAEQARLEREYAEKLNVYKPEWPAMQQLKTQIERGRQNLQAVTAENAAKARDAARSEYLTALRREEQLKSMLAGEKNAAMAQNVNAVEYNNLRNEVDTKRALLDTLLKRNAENEVTSRMRDERISSVRIVDRAIAPGRPFAPSMKDSLVTSSIIGFLVAVAFVFFLEYLDRSLRTSDQVERVLRLPALGVIPSVGSARRNYGYGRIYGYSERTKIAAPEEKIAIELLPHDHPRSSVAEAYRAFRTSLLLSRAGGVNTIAITSSLPAEGKTSTALNLAVVLGQLGRRVLLIDADLHRPRLHETLRVSNRVGLVSILAENISPTDAISKTPIPGVFFVPSGPNSPNPSGLLSSESMRKFISFVSANFDHVILDTPPVSLIADALMIGNVVDGVVLTIRGGKTSREQVARTRDRLLRSNARILGALINNLEEDHATYGRYYAYYGSEGGKTKSAGATARSA
jgi:capsular exopolysaccharide synthesis family protein